MYLAEKGPELSSLACELHAASCTVNQLHVPAHSTR